MHSWCVPGPSPSHLGTRLTIYRRGGILKNLHLCKQLDTKVRCYSNTDIPLDHFPRRSGTPRCPAAERLASQMRNLATASPDPSPMPSRTSDSKSIVVTHTHVPLQAPQIATVLLQIL